MVSMSEILERYEEQYSFKKKDVEYIVNLASKSLDILDVRKTPNYIRIELCSYSNPWEFSDVLYRYTDNCYVSCYTNPLYIFPAITKYNIHEYKHLENYLYLYNKPMLGDINYGYCICTNPYKLGDICLIYDDTQAGCLVSGKLIP